MLGTVFVRIEPTKRQFVRQEVAYRISPLGVLQAGQHPVAPLGLLFALCFESL